MAICLLTEIKLHYFLITSLETLIPLSDRSTECIHGTLSLSQTLTHAHTLSSKIDAWLPVYFISHLLLSTTVCMAK